MFFIFWIVTLVGGSSSQRCSTQSSVIFCTKTNSSNLLHEIFKLRNITNTTFGFSYDLEVTRSVFPYINSFPSPLPSSFIMEKLALTDSLVEFVEHDAFEDVPFLRVLSLTRNLLTDISFVNSLPADLEELYLNNNHFSVVTNVFSRLTKLTVVDLSECNITAISTDSFQSFYSAIYINLRKNELTTFDVTFTNGLVVYLDLSCNNLRSIDCHFSRAIFSEFNISGNSLTVLKDCNLSMARFVDVSFNNLSNTSNLLHDYNVFNLNFASSGIDDNFPFALLSTSKHVLNLSNNNITKLKSLMFGSKVEIDNLILFNCSITTIAANAFSNLHDDRLDNMFQVINISSNPIIVLNDYAFNSTRVQIVDASNCLIKQIQDNAFSGLLLTNILKLNNNRLTLLNSKTFKDLFEVEIIDLSYNALKKINNDIFTNCAKLRVLNLSHSKIEVIRNGAFAGAFSLSELYLQNNLIDKIEFSTPPLTLLALENNFITNLSFSFAENVSSRFMLLAFNNMGQLTNNSRLVMCCTKQIDLSNSNISKIEIDAFRGHTSLEILSLRNNLLETIFPHTFLGLKHLVELDLRDNPLTVFSKDAFVFGNRLSAIHVTFHGVWKGEMFLNLNFLKTLDLAHSNISLLEGNSFKGLFSLDKLIVKNVSVANIAAGAFNGLDSLENINFQSCLKNLTVIKSRQFEGLSKLSHLDLFKLNVSVLEAESFTGLLSLEKLSLNNNNIAKIVNNTFLGLNSLKFLNLSSNRISSLEIYGFYGLDNLLELSLSDNNLTGPALGTFQNFPKLRTLNLSKNNISYLLTGTFSNLKDMVMLDLSFNNITRLEVHDIISLRDLQHLDLTHNHLIQMEYLDLVKLLRQLKFIGINDNKWKCDDLVKMLATFRKYNIEWVSTRSMTLLEENINGIKCFDICKFFYCV